MTQTFTYLLDAIEASLDDQDNNTWSRNVLIGFAKEAIRVFPILKPQQEGYTLVSASHTIDLPAAFREIVSVEYPVAQDPPIYLKRMNWLDQDFYSSEQHYDVDQDYSDGSGWVLHLSRLMVASDHLHINYLATHDTTMADDASETVSIQDEHLHIIVAYVVMKCYRERLSDYMQDPGAYNQVIAQMVEAVTRAEAHYAEVLTAAQAYLAASRPSPKRKVDAYDRVY